MTKLRAILLVLAFAVSLSVSTVAYDSVSKTSAANAAIPCQTPRVCTYWDNAYNGSMYYYTRPSGPPPICVNISEPWNNDITSIKNDSPYDVEFFGGSNCSGILHVVIYFASKKDFAGTIYNDAFSSFRWIT
jgi:hypothetical protein